MPSLDPIAAKPPAGFDGVVLAGGTGRRLGGVDKGAIVISGRSLLDRALDAVADAGRVVVVGEGRTSSDPTSRIVTASEQPPGGGPVAAVAAALPLVTADIVVILACDMPLLTATVVRTLVHSVGDAEAALAVDGDGRRQFLAGAYRRLALARAVADLPVVDGAAMRTVVGGLTVVEVVTDPEVTLDADTWDDVARSRRLLEEP